MNKQGRYINYIVKDLIKQTEIDGQGLLTFPFMFDDDVYYNTILKSMSPPKRFFLGDFLYYAKNTYGVRDEEGEIIFDRYIELLQNG